MTTLDDLARVATDGDRPLTETVRHHFLEAILRRIGHTPDPILVLRGSLITRQWAHPFPRIAGDLDFLATFPHDVGRVTDRILPTLAADLSDGVRFLADRCRGRGMWLDSDFPGVRLTVEAEVFGHIETATIDVGFGDPLVPEARVVDYRPVAGDRFEVWAVHRATLIGWKLHGLAEWGHARWRPKDLLDLWLLVTQLPPPPVVDLAPAIRVAFTSRGYDVHDARRTLVDPFWGTHQAAGRWRRLCTTYHDTPIPQTPAMARDVVLSHLDPALP